MLSRALIATAAVVAALILMATATVFLCAALYFFLISLSAVPSLAALLTGLTVLIVAALILFAARLALRNGWLGGNAGTAGTAPAGNINDLAAQLGGFAAQGLTAQAQAHPYRAFAVSLLAGLAVGGSPELRKLLAKLLKNQ